MAAANTDEQRLLLKPREAAMLLNISERQLWEHTSPRGPIPATRIGNCVRYSREGLQNHIRQQQRQAIVDDIRRLQQDGDSVAEIAQKLYLDEPTVQHAIDRGTLLEPQPQWATLE